MLIKIIDYFNNKKTLPLKLDTMNIFYQYKDDTNKDYYNVFFKKYNNDQIIWKNNIEITNISMNDVHFTDYKNLNFKEISPIVDKYFSPSDIITKHVNVFKSKYKINYDETLACYYRGTDISSETNVISFAKYINRVRNILQKNPEIKKILLTTDEIRYIKPFIKEFPNTIIIKELVYYNTRGFTHALALLPSIILMSNCKHIITTSNNVSFWTILYRGNADNVLSISLSKTIYK